MSANQQPEFRAAEKALKLCLPFVLYRLPGADSVEFFADDPSSASLKSNRLFEIGPWLANYSQRVVIRDILDADNVLALTENYGAASAVPHSEDNQFRNISKEEYLKAVAAIIERCAKRNGKTVYSRAISGANSHLSVTDTAQQLFAEFPETFGFLYFTPLTGCWLGATPETLLTADLASNRLSTMALAGTRLNLGNSPWDSKNLNENQIVADYIVNKFRSLGLNPEVSIPLTVDYGNIQHIRRDISAIYPNSLSISDIIDAINPTPALCGTPLPTAINDIAEFEPHQRNCYGGFIAIHEPGRQFRSFVNLRCANISPLSTSGYRFTIFVGGGIIAQSNPETEWHETCAKASRLLAILQSL